MKKTVIVILSIVIVTGLVFFFHQGPDLPTIVVSMTKQGFEPSVFTVGRGQVVEFRNITEDAYFWPASDLHPTHELYSEFDPLEPVSPGEVWSFKFNRVGVWKFHDHIKANLRGTITVTK
jgi:hypothetical protein